MGIVCLHTYLDRQQYISANIDDIAEILLKVALNTKKIKSIIMHVLSWTVDMFLKEILPLAMVWMQCDFKERKKLASRIGREPTPYW
jgi:hypothetical protein